jgi:site-specific DNA-methyltransferase (adenine-specific)
MALTLDVWSIPPESARRVGHPAPFPVELPEQLINLYTFRDDLVLDPFMGSGSTLAAAARLDRRYVGYDLDPVYVEIARQRVAATTETTGSQTDRARRAAGDGVSAQRYAEQVLVDAGFTIASRGRRVRGTGIAVDFVATDADGATWYFDVAGPFTSYRGGMQRIEIVWRALGRAAAVRGSLDGAPFVILTTALPRRPSDGDRALHAAGPTTFFDAVDLVSDDAVDRLKRYAKGAMAAAPLPGFWPADVLG